MPIQLKYDHISSDVALDRVLFCGDRVSSLTINHGGDRTPLLRELVVFRRAPVERLHLYTDCTNRWKPEHEPAHDIW